MSGPQQPGDWRLHDHSVTGPPEHDQPEWAQPAADQAVPGRRPLTSRGRSWLLFLAAMCLVLTYVVIWTMYADTHQTDRFIQRPPGEPSQVTVNHAQYRVHSMIKTERIENADDPEDPAVAEAGTIFVLAEVEVVQLAEDDLFFCQAELAVSGVRRIADSAPYNIDDKKLPTSCDKDEFGINEPYRFLAIFRVPTRFADEIYGIAVYYTDYGAPYQVIRPPA